MAIHAGGSLTEGEQRRLADVRRFLSPWEQSLLEASLRNLAADPRLPPGEAEAALKRSLAGVVSPSDFCARLANELSGLALTGPEARSAERLALAVPIEEAFERWLSDAGRHRYREPGDLARAVRDGETRREDFALAAPLAAPGAPLFLTDAAAFGSGTSAARVQCLGGPPARSYVVAIVEARSLRAPLRVPTAADAVCRPGFQLAPEDAEAGVTCSGHPEYVTEPHPLEVVSEFRSSR